MTTRLVCVSHTRFTIAGLLNIKTAYDTPKANLGSIVRFTREVRLNKIIMRLEPVGSHKS